MVQPHNTDSDSTPFPFSFYYSSSPHAYSRIPAEYPLRLVVEPAPALTSFHADSSAVPVACGLAAMVRIYFPLLVRVEGSGCVSGLISASLSSALLLRQGSESVYMSSEGERVAGVRTRSKSFLIEFLGSQRVTSATSVLAQP